MNEVELKLYIKKLSFEYGFDDVGFVPYQLMEEESNNYKEWLNNGYNAGMEWANNYQDIRKDIRLLLPNANSVIVLLHNYKTVNHQSEKNKISRYAWGDDYHNVIKKKLKKITNDLKSKLESNNQTFGYRYFVDSAPILERQWAVKSGIGWQGKNGMFISKKKGSYLFISVIISNLIFEQNTLEKDYCGKCTKCIDACPTNAIVKPKVIDSNKCIPYWTIETRDERQFPNEIKENINNWAFGCDICQEVCPWNNHRVPITSELSFFPRNGKTNFEFEEIINLTDEEFTLKFINSPIKRAKNVGLKRNLEEIK